MKITSKILHIPPHLSTSWTQVSAIYLKETDLIVSLIDGSTISIPGLSTADRDAIFTAYATYLEEHPTKPQERPIPFQLFQASPLPNNIAGAPFGEAEGTASIRFAFDSMESLTSAMQHNMAQANSPNMPKEILNKIASVAKIVAPGDIQNMPKPEPHCNCPHCQIARAIHQAFDHPEETPVTAKVDSPQLEEDEVSDKDLSFQQWEINQTGDKLYSVTNRLDTQERYSVYLGHPVGCTCGNQGCEHILAVLKS